MRPPTSPRPCSTAHSVVLLSGASVLTWSRRLYSWSDLSTCMPGYASSRMAPDPVLATNTRPSLRTASCVKRAGSCTRRSSSPAARARRPIRERPRRSPWLHAEAAGLAPRSAAGRHSCKQRGAHSTAHSPHPWQRPAPTEPPRCWKGASCVGAPRSRRSAAARCLDPCCRGRCRSARPGKCTRPAAAAAAR
jgi:hypothetical protein